MVVALLFFYQTWLEYFLIHQLSKLALEAFLGSAIWFHRYLVVGDRLMTSLMCHHPLFRILLSVYLIVILNICSLVLLLEVETGKHGAGSIYFLLSFELLKVRHLMLEVLKKVALVWIRGICWLVHWLCRWDSWVSDLLKLIILWHLDRVSMVLSRWVSLGERICIASAPFELSRLRSCLRCYSSKFIRNGLASCMIWLVHTNTGLILVVMLSRCLGLGGVD